MPLHSQFHKIAPFEDWEHILEQLANLDNLFFFGLGFYFFIINEDSIDIYLRLCEYRTYHQEHIIVSGLVHEGPHCRFLDLGSVVHKKLVINLVPHDLF